jgi:3-oxoacyl-[acyl-carrier protein] reductase
MIAQASSHIASMRTIQRDEVPEDLCGALIFLSSDDSDFITGQALLVEGGLSMH